MYSQNIVNSSSNYTNNLEYNTGEIFVVYNFASSEVTSKEVFFNDEEVTETLVEKTITIYPNPTSKILYYTLSKEINFESLEICDQFQKRIFKTKEDIKQVSLEEFPTGIYYLMFNKNKKYYFKILKK